jgi:translocation and assembly module TamA
MFFARPSQASSSELRCPRILAQVATTLLFMLSMAASMPARAADQLDSAADNAAEPNAGVRYTVSIDAPGPLAELLEKNLDLVRFRGNADIDLGQLEQLVRVAPDQVRTLVATEGFYTPDVSARLDTSGAAPVVLVNVVPGAAVQVGSIELVLQGFAASNPQDREPFKLQPIRDGWGLKEGQVFRQSDWESAKRNLLREVLKTRYAHAQLSASLATVDPETRLVALRVVIDSGPELRFGDISIEGLQRYPASIITNLNQIKPGDFYSEARLQTLQSSLQDTTYFSSVEVSADLPLGDARAAPEPEPVPDGATEIASDNATGTALAADAATATEAAPAAAQERTRPTVAPLLVRVTENKKQNVTAGLGYSTNTGNRSQLNYDNLSVFGLKFKSALMLETKRQTARGHFYFPTTPNGYDDSFGASYEHNDIAGEETRVGTVAAKRAWGTLLFERSLTLEFVNETRIVSGLPDAQSKALPLTYGVTLRRLDSLLFPNQGYVLNAQLGAALLPILTDEKFVRASAKAIYYQPLTSNSKLIFRGALGALASNDKAGVPSIYLFRAGGDQSVRGYGFQKLGVAAGDAIVGGRYLATASAEYQYWFTPTWGAATFYDAGNAADSLQDLHPKSGYGLGARYNSPVGPINVDVAYGHSVQEYKLHFSLGFTF